MHAEFSVTEARSREEVELSYERRFGVGSGRLSRLLQLPIEARASGALVWAQDGREYIDMGGFGVFFLGHRHPAVTAAVRQQLDQMPLSTRLFLSVPLANAADALAAAAPDGLDRVAFVSSGAEAVELGLKLAYAAGARRFISARGGFHGKTTGALSMTSNDRFRQPFAGLLREPNFVSFGEVDALAAALHSTERAAVLLEPIQGEGGVIVPPDGYLAAVRELCDAHDAILILDEVQTGLGRTGEWWAADREAVVPDILLAGKALGGGVSPVAAVVASAGSFVALERDPLVHSTTFGGNPLAMSAVLATLSVIQSDGLVERAHDLGGYLKQGLKLALAPLRDVVRDVRGVGLLLAVEFSEPFLGVAFISALLDAGVISSYSLSAETVVRLTPPAIMSEAEVDRGLAAVADAADAVVATYL